MFNNYKAIFMKTDGIKDLEILNTPNLYLKSLYDQNPNMATIERVYNITNFGKDKIKSEQPKSIIKKFLTAFSNDDNEVPVITLYGILGVGFNPFFSELGLCTNLDDFLGQLIEFQNSGLPKLIINCDSPGGYCAPEQMDVVSKINELKNEGREVICYVSSECASLAYFIASACSSIICKNKMCCVGSLGSFITIADYSKLYENEGIKIINVSSGGVKGAFTPGLEVSEEYIEQVQYMIDELTQIFKDTVAERNPKLVKLFTGNYWMAADALKNGLIDEISNHDQLRVVKNINPTHDSEEMTYKNKHINQTTIEETIMSKKQINDDEDIKEVDDENEDEVIEENDDEKVDENSDKVDDENMEKPEDETTELIDGEEDDEDEDDDKVDVVEKQKQYIAELENKIFELTNKKEVVEENVKPIVRNNTSLKAGKEFKSIFDEYRASNPKLSYNDALIKCATLHPDKYREYVGK